MTCDLLLKISNSQAYEHAVQCRPPLTDTPGRMAAEAATAVAYSRRSSDMKRTRRKMRMIWYDVTTALDSWPPCWKMTMSAICESYG